MSVSIPHSLYISAFHIHYTYPRSTLIASFPIVSISRLVAGLHVLKHSFLMCFDNQFSLCCSLNCSCERRLVHRIRPIPSRFCALYRTYPHILSTLSLRLPLGTTSSQLAPYLHLEPTARGSQ